MFEEFLMDKDEIRKKIQNENEKKMKIISKRELQLLKYKRKNILDEYSRLKDTLKFKEDEFKRLRKPYEQHDKKRN